MIENKNTSLKFSPISSRDTFLRDFLLSMESNICDYSFSNLLLWKGFYQTEWCRIENFIVFRIRCFGKERFAYLEPIPILSPTFSQMEALLKKLKAHALENDCIFRLQFLSEKFVETYRPLLLDCLVYEDRNYANYIHSTEKLSTLAGRRFQSKRNHFYRFLKENETYRVKALDASDRENALFVCDAWLQSKETSNSLLLEERKMIEKAFEYFQALSLEGVIIFSHLEEKEKPIAFAFGSRLNENTFCVHVEKTLPEFLGASSAIGKFLAEQLKGRYAFLNREEDLGLSGLRKSKLSWHPDKMESVFFAVDKKSEEAKIHALWKECFLDEDSFIASYLLPYSNEKSRVLRYENKECPFDEKELIGMAHIHLFSSLESLVGYIYALAVSKNFRGKGIGKELIEESLRRLKKAGAQVAWVIQGNENFSAWENHFDFCRIKNETQNEEDKDSNKNALSIKTKDEFDFLENAPSLVRVLSCKNYFEDYVKTHPDFKGEYILDDKIFPENSGLYCFADSKVEFIPEEKIQTPRKSISTISPSDVFRLAPPGIDLVFVS